MHDVVGAVAACMRSHVAGYMRQQPLFYAFASMSLMVRLCTVCPAPFVTHRYHTYCSGGWFFTCLFHLVGDIDTSPT